LATVTEQRAGLAEAVARTRAETMGLVSTLEPDDMVVQTAPYTSPPKWHAGHVSWVFEMVIRKADASYSPTPMAGSPYLNSYYLGAGSPHPKGERGAVSRPTAAELLEYHGEVTRRLGPILREARAGGEAGRLLEMAMHHECQHQELMVYDLQHMLASRYEPPSRAAPPEPSPRARPRTRTLRGGRATVGHGGGGYAYDIEMPAHEVLLADYEIDVFPVTCGQYAEFVGDGGYTDYRHWLSDGWDAVREGRWEAPMYWERDGSSWAVHDMAGRRPIVDDEPVRCVSYYEADAYCRWAGRRLPTEFEWEAAARGGGGSRPAAFPWGDEPPDASRANLLESRLWAPARVGSYPGGASACGCEQMIGDVWEWTSSEFAPYPGFESGFDEYNDKWFGGQKVLRGGSSATPAASIRATYRNFFRPHERWMFAGFRCAR